MSLLPDRLVVPPAVQDVVLLAARLGLGVVLISHGWQKLRENGLSATAEGFDAMGIPAPMAAAVFATAVELVGGVLLVVGLLTPVVGVLVAANMAGAWWFAHRGDGIAGMELVATIGLLALVLAAVGPGRLAAHRLLSRGSSRPRAALVDA